MEIRFADPIRAGGRAGRVNQAASPHPTKRHQAPIPLQGGGDPHMPLAAFTALHLEGRSMPTKTREKKAGSTDKVNALQKPVQPSEELAAIVGSAPLPRAQVVSKIWDYIRSHNLQNSENRREILADDKLRKVFGKDKVTMFEMNKHLAGHLK